MFALFDLFNRLAPMTTAPSTHWRATLATEYLVSDGAGGWGTYQVVDAADGIGWQDYEVADA